jgi:hypothetical protein
MEVTLQIALVDMAESLPACNTDSLYLKTASLLGPVKR